MNEEMAIHFPRALWVSTERTPKTMEMRLIQTYACQAGVCEGSFQDFKKSDKVSIPFHLLWMICTRSPRQQSPWRCREHNAYSYLMNHVSFDGEKVSKPSSTAA